MGDAYLEYPETREGTVDFQRPVSDHGCLRAEKGPCNKRLWRDWDHVDRSAGQRDRGHRGGRRQAQWCS